MKYSLLTVVTACALITAACADTVVLRQNFDNTTIFPTNTGLGNNNHGDGTTEGGTWIAESTSGDPTPVTSQYYSATQSLRMSLGATGNAGLVGTRTNDSILTGTFELTMEVYEETADATWWVTTAETLKRVNLAMGIASSGGVFKVLNNGLVVSANVSTVSVPLNQWVGIKISGDLDTQIWSAYVDTGSGWTLIDSRSFDKTKVIDTATNTGINTIFFRPTVRNPTGKVYIDNVLLTVPEPATLGLLGMGGLLALLKRKK